MDFNNSNTHDAMHGLWYMRLLIMLDFNFDHSVV